VTAALVVPKDWSELTPEWMTAALAERQPGAVVDAVTVAMRDDGTNRRARLAVTYEAGPAGPAKVFVKAVDPDHKFLIKLTSGLLHEPRLFNSKVELPLEHPLVYAAVIDEADEDFMLVMEDLTERDADPRDATRPLSVEQAADGVRGLARMHGQYWVRASNARSWTGSSRSCHGRAWGPRRCRLRWTASATTPRPPSTRCPSGHSSRTCGSPSSAR
jgi:hypothetical protein